MFDSVLKTIDMMISFSFSATLKMCAKRSSAVSIGSLSMSTLSILKGAESLIAEMFYDPNI